jgi:tellurite resistance protein TerC
VVLTWVGTKTLLQIDVLYIPTTVSLAVVALILGVSIIASMIAPRDQERGAIQASEDSPFRVATEEEIVATTSA